jgi:hypothetical protein
VKTEPPNDNTYMRRALALTVLVMLTSALSGTANAGPWVMQSPEKGFTYRGKPIDPRCVTVMFAMEEGSPNAVDLTSCTKPGHVTRDGHSIEIVEPDPEAVMSTPFDSYEVLARNGSRFVVSTFSSGGGSGRFSILLLLHRTADKLIVDKSFPEGSGDRCNGGFAGATVSGNRLQWSVNITPSDMIRIGGITLPDGSWTLESGAQSCVATADSEYDFDTGKTRLVSETLTLSYFGGTSEAVSGLLSDQGGWTERYAYQHCFNLYYNDYVSRGHKELSPADIKTFAQGFARTCLKKP